MKISTKGRYGLRLMIELGMNYEKNVIPLKEIAERQNVSEKYLEQIINQLSKAGLVKGTRGSQGGYSLFESPDEITIRQILQTLEGTLSPVSCLDFPENTCERASSCAALELWSEIHEAVIKIMDDKTLGQLVRRQMELCGKV